jgi:RNA polymerase sigma-70 factor (ECF subfamily)
VITWLSMDDFELIEGWVRGDLKAANELLRRFYPLLRRFFAAKLHDDGTREDLIQETFKGLLGAIARYEGRSSAKAFVLGIARNKLNDHLRARHRAGFDPMRDSVEDVLGKSPSSFAAMRERDQHLLGCIAALPVDDRILLELSYWHDMSSLELAAIFETTPEAVRSRSYRARQTLERMLGSSTPSPHGAEQSDAFDTRLRELGLELD